MLATRAGLCFIASFVVVNVVLTGCTSPDESVEPTPTAPIPQDALYLTEGVDESAITSDIPISSLDEAKVVLAGAPVSDDFKVRLDQVNPRLADTGYVFAPEAYDAVVVTALAAQLAQADAGTAIAEHMSQASADGEKCTAFAECNEMLHVGQDFDFDGVSGPIEFDDAGDVTQASIGTYEYDAGGQLPGYDVAGEAVSYSVGEVDATSVPSEPSSPSTDGGDGQLKLGGLLPLTGPATALSPAETAGIRLAVKEINGAGGVLGRPVIYYPGDSGDDAQPDQALATVQSHILQGVDAIVGGATSQASITALPTATQAGILQVSPSATSAELTFAQDADLFFRTAPSDALRGQVLADVMTADGVQQAAIATPRDSDRTGLAWYTAQAFANGGGEVISGAGSKGRPISYDPASAQSLTRVVQRQSPTPQAIVVVGLSGTTDTVR